MSDVVNTAQEQQKKVVGRPFVKGQSGNPNGRPKGSKNELSEEFVRALLKDFREFGPEAICAVREEKTDAYLNVIAKVLPKDINVKHDPLDDMEYEQLKSRCIELGGLLRNAGILPGYAEAEAPVRQEQAGELPPVH